MAKKIGLFYAPKGGSTEKAAIKIVEALGEDLVDLIFVNKANPEDLSNYSNIIFGTATVGNDVWDGKHPRNGWDVFFPQIIKSDFTNKNIALFGLGNQINYPNHFVDSIGVFYSEIIKKNATIVGFCSKEGYDFGESEAFINGKFVGLPLDEDTQPELTDERIKQWAVQIAKEFNL